jgi:hypothetical protein
VTLRAEWDIELVAIRRITASSTLIPQDKIECGSGQTCNGIPPTTATKMLYCFALPNRKIPADHQQKNGHRKDIPDNLIQQIAGSIDI